MGTNTNARIKTVKFANNDEITEKKCIGCYKIFPVSMFYYTGANKDGYMNRCKKCQLKYMKKWNEEHKEIIQERNHRNYLIRKKK